MSDPQIPDRKPDPPKIPVQKPSGWVEPPHIPHYRNPPETVNPDAATLRDQWRYALRQYSRWYSQAWGSAILAGATFFALGWIIKGSNPLPSFQSDNTHREASSPPAAADAADKDKAAHQPR